MDNNLQSQYDQRLSELVDEASRFDIESKESTEAWKNVRLISEIRPLLPVPEPAPDPVPETVWEKVRCTAAAVLDNETTRTAIKAGGALAGVLAVVYSTIYKDHVMTREALTQANQRNS